VQTFGKVIVTKKLSANVKPYKLDYFKYQNPVTGATLFAATDPEGDMVEIINHYIKQSAPNLSYSSLESHFFGIKKFTEYLTVAIDMLSDSIEYEKRPVIHVLIENYPFYLSKIYGERTNLNRKIREVTGHSLLSSSSLSKEISHVNKFIEQSASYAKLVVEENPYAYILNKDKYEIHDELERVEPLSKNQKYALRTKSLLGAVIKQSESINMRTFLTVPKVLRIKKSGTLEENKVFPAEKLIELIKVANLREKLLYTVLAGAGLRTHEGLQIMLDDFDEDLNLLIRDNSERLKMDSMSDAQLLDMYKRKGRATDRVFWIPELEPLFAELLKAYLPWRKKQLIEGGLSDHKFLFVKSKSNQGEPLYLTSRVSLDNMFSKNCEKIGVDDRTKHSLRHFYGYHMLNSVIKEDGSHFSIQEVQKLMGHASISATQVYARPDMERLAYELETAKTLVLDAINNKLLGI
jgi:integrase